MHLELVCCCLQRYFYKFKVLFYLYLIIYLILLLVEPWPKCKTFYQACGVGGTISNSNSDLSKFPTPILPFRNFWLLNIKEWYLAVKINRNCGAQQEISVSTKVSKETTISTGITKLRVWLKKWSNWTSGVRQKNPTLTPSVVRNLTPTPPKNLWLRNPAFFVNNLKSSSTVAWCTLLVVLFNVRWSATLCDVIGRPSLVSYVLA